jgi:CheY-like chemotaxis protein
MTNPLALVFYERLLPGTQLVNRLQDLGYRVLAVHASVSLERDAEREKPLLVFADLESTKNDVCADIARLKKNPATQHLPVIAFGREERVEMQEAARAAGAVAVGESTLLSHLPELLDRALQVE